MLDQFHTQLEEGVLGLRSSPAWQQFLDFASSFHRYSFNNVILLLTQKPDATLVASFNAWRARGYAVVKGEKALRVLAPMTYRQDMIDDAGKPVLDATGQPHKQTVVKGWKLVPVFDASQVDPSPTDPGRPVRLVGQAPEGLWDALASIVTDNGFQLERGDCGHANGFTSYAHKLIRVDDRLDDAHAVKTLAHEIGHMLMHSPEGDTRPDCDGVVEVEAESVAYIVMAAHGMDTTSYSFPYVEAWGDRAATATDTELVQIIRSTGQKVVACADRILTVTQPPSTEEETTALADDITRTRRDLAASTSVQLTMRPLATSTEQTPAPAPAQPSLL